jgi:hypothetical protein
MNPPSTLQARLNRFRDQPPHALLLTARAFASRGLSMIEALSIAETLCGLPTGYPKAGSLTDLRHPDIWVADPERNTLRLEELSALAERVNFPPQQLSRRLIIIDRAGRLNTHASNALLKSIEEPLSPCLYVLTTSSVQDVLPTVASRCVRAHIRLDESDISADGSELEEADRQFLQLVIDGLCRSSVGQSHQRGQAATEGRGFSFFEKGLDSAEHLARKYPWITLVDALAEEVSAHCRKSTASALALESATHMRFPPGLRWLIARLRDWKTTSEYNPSAVIRLTEIILAASREGHRTVPF